MKFPIFLPLLAASVTVAPAATLISDDFDSGSVSGDWYRNSGTTVLSGGAAGSSNAVRINPSASNTSGLGDQVGGADSFVLDFHFRVRNDSTNRQFSVTLTTASYFPGPDSAAINLRYQGGNSGSFAIYNGSSSSWQNIALGSVASESWYRMQIEGTGWGTPSANYTLRLSDAGGDTFTQVLTGLTTVQVGSITGNHTTGSPSVTYPGTLQAFAFTPTYGANPGFDVDNIILTGNVIPEAATLSLALAALPLTLRRRRGITFP